MDAKHFLIGNTSLLAEGSFIASRSSTRLGRTLLLLLGLLLGFTSGQSWSDSFRIDDIVTIDVPGFSQTGMGGINNRGVVLGGAYGLIGSTSPLSVSVVHLDHLLAYIQPSADAPAGSSIFARGINDRSQIVGNDFQGGFLLSDGIFTPLAVPNEDNTQPLGINNRGQIVGFFSNPFRGFLYSGGAFTIIDIPNAVHTRPHGINDHGQIVGDITDASGEQHGFLLSQGVVTIIDFPNARNTSARGINNRGQIVGAYFEIADEADHGFVLSGHTFSTIDIPGSVFTDVNAINDWGQIAGSYFDATGGHGFEANLHRFTNRH